MRRWSPFRFTASGPTVQRLAALLSACILFSGGNAFGQTKFSGTTMGPIVYNVTVVDDVKNRDELDAAIKEELENINQLMSTYIGDSDVSRVNAAGEGVWTEVDLLTLEVIKRAMELSRATSGAFDITVGPAVNAWRFGPASNGEDVNSDELPDDAEIEKLKSIVGFELIETQPQPPAIRKKQAGAQIDLSAIAKGFAVDVVADLLSKRGYRNYMVEVGGEVKVRGRGVNDRFWRIGIEQPVQSSRQIGSVVRLNDNSLATSGDYRNFYIVDGQKYSHAIDPVTCRPVRGEVASATVLADDCMTADALATAVMVMGSDKGIEICQQLGVECSITGLISGGPEPFATVSTSGFPSESEQTASNQTASIWPAFIGALVIFGLAIAGMAVGSIFNNRPITGSCGGIAATANEDGSESCSLCQKPVAECPEKQTV